MLRCVRNTPQLKVSWEYERNGSRRTTTVVTIFFLSFVIVPNGSHSSRVGKEIVTATT